MPNLCYVIYNVKPVFVIVNILKNNYLNTPFYDDKCA